MKHVVLLPRTSDGYLQQEECCWGYNSASGPALAFHVAQHLRAIDGDKGEVELRPIHLTDDQTVVAGDDDATTQYHLIFSWIFGVELEAWIRRAMTDDERARLHLIANPSDSANDLALRMAAQSIPVAEISTARRFMLNGSALPWSALPDRHWRNFRAITVQFSTGCPWRCDFCVWAHGYRLRDPLAVAADVRQLIERVPAAAKNPTGASILLLGNEISGKPAWLQGLCQSLPSGLAWGSDLNVRNTTAEDVLTAARAGLRSACIGIEFLDDAMLTKLRKGHTVQEAFDVMAMLEDRGIRYRFSLRQGVGETPEDLRRLLGNLTTMALQNRRPERIYIASMVNWPGPKWLPVTNLSEPECYNVGSAAYPRWAMRLPEESLNLWKEITAFCRTRGWA